MAGDRSDAAPSRVTVGIPCFEQAEWLGEALASVAAQTVPAVETIVVDDGSSPPEAQRIRELCRQFGARHVRVTNRGLPGARNTALMLARGDAFLPLDADDWIEPEYIEKTLPWLRDADFVCVGLQEHGLRDNVFMPGYDRPLEQVTLELELQMNRIYYCSLFRTDLLRSVGGYNGRMVNGYEDWDLAIDLIARGARFVAVDEILFHYRVRPDGLLAEAERSHRQRNIAEMSRHHGLGPSP
jgi:glycosyltransferase involved in cell wall biosynthesis